MRTIVECPDCGKQYSMGSERAGQRLPCRECGGTIWVPGRQDKRKQGGKRVSSQDAGAPLISTNMALMIGGCVGLMLLLVLAAVTNSVRRRSTEVVAITPGMSAADAERLSQTMREEGELEARKVQNEMINKLGQAFRGAAPDARGPAFPGVDPGQLGKSGDGAHVEGADAMPGLQANQRALNGVMGPWKPCVDPMSPDLLTDWQPSKSHRLPSNDRGSLKLAYAGLGSPYLAAHSFPFDDEWTIFDIRSKRPIGVGVAGRSFMDSVALRKDGQYFAAYVENGVALTDVRKKEFLGTFPIESGFGGQIEFLGSNRLAAVGSDQIRVWSLPDGKPLRSIAVGGVFSRSVTFSPGGRFAAIWTGDFQQSSIRVVDVDSGEEMGILLMPWTDDAARNPPMGISTDGRELAAVVGGKEKTLVVWNLESGEIIDDFVVAAELENNMGIDRSTLDWFPNKQRWLLNSSIVIDRKSRSVAFRLDANGTWSPPAMVASDSNLIAIVSEARFKGVAVADLTGPPFNMAAATEIAASNVTNGGLPLLREADWSIVQDLDPVHDTVAWSVKPDPDVISAEPLLGSIAIPAKEDRLEDLRFSGRNAACVALAYDTSPSRNTSKRDNTEFRVETFSLTSGRRVKELKLPVDSQLMALSSSGNRVVMRLDRDGYRIDVWDMNEKTHVAAWRPGDSGSRIDAAAFVDDSHVLTLDSNKTLVLWELPSCRAIYRVSEAEGPGVSPKGKYLAIRSRNVYVIVEALTGKIAGRLTTDDTISAAAFHPDGDLFAAVTKVGGYFQTNFADLIVWDLRSGTQISHVPLRYAGSSMHWCGRDHVLMDNTLLVDIRRQLPLWTYSIRSGLHSMLAPNDQHWYVCLPDRGGRGELKLRSVSLPEADVAIETADKTARNTIALSPGGKVAIRFDVAQGPVSPELNRKIVECVRVELARNGIGHSDDAPVQVSLSIQERLRNGSTVYYSGGFGMGGFGRLPEEHRGPGQTVQNREIECVVKFTLDGKVLWSSHRVFDRALYLSLQEGQSLTDAMRQQLWISAAHFFQELRLPKYVYHADEGFGYGSTTLTYDGPVRIGSDAIRPDDVRGYPSNLDLDFWRYLLP